MTGYIVIYARGTMLATLLHPSGSPHDHAQYYVHLRLNARTDYQLAKHELFDQNPWYFSLEVYIR